MYVTLVLCVIATASSSGTSFFAVRRARSETVCLILLLSLGGRGTWTEDEVKCLKEAVYQVTKTAEDQPVPFHGIYWPDVAKIVKTRNIEQCRRKW